MAYTVFTDTACDIPNELLDAWNVRHISLKFTYEGEDVSYAGDEVDPIAFYDSMRGGRVARTAAANVEEFVNAFKEALLSTSGDIFYLAFSSGLSSTCANAVVAADDLKEEFPDRRIVVVDSLAASSGYGLLLYFVVKKRDQGADIDELKDYAEGIRLKICHWFTVDNLVYLKRGGRISAATALAGTVLGIKPILHVDDEGHLINVGKAKGRKASVRAIADKYGELIDKNLPESETVYISHADCKEDAEELAKIISEKFGAKTELITGIGPVIGAHSGPGTLAVFFVGTHR